MTTLHAPHEPHKIKTVRLTASPTVEQRKQYLTKAWFNVFSLTPSQLTFDMTSLGTGAVSQEQVAGQFVGDEAYAGARNFIAMKKAINEVLGLPFVCPTHNTLGSLKLVMATMVADGQTVLTNAKSVDGYLSHRTIRSNNLRDTNEKIFTGHLDTKTVSAALDKGNVAMIFVQLFADGQHPVSLTHLETLHNLAKGHKVPMVIDASRIVENAWYVQKHEDGQHQHTIGQIVKQMASTADVLHMDGAEDPKAVAGGFLATTNNELYEKFMNEVVVYEGLHTYGGMAGRTMELLARGLTEMVFEDEAQWIMHQAERFTGRLRDAGVPLERGCDGAYLDAEAFLPHLKAHQDDALSAALYLTSGIRAVATGLRQQAGWVPVQIPRMGMTNRQLDQVADAIIHVYNNRDKVPALTVASEGPWRDQMKYRAVLAEIEPYTFDTAPYTIHTIERVGLLSEDARRKAIVEAGYNTFLLPSEDVTIDLLTDSGTSAMSTDQWGMYTAAKAASATTTDEYADLITVLQETLGYEHIIPTHQGRAAEHILSQIMIKPGQYVPGNMYFTTTKLHQEMAGGIFADVIVDEAHKPDSEFPWKGNIDMDKLRKLVDEHGADKMAYISFEHSVNMAGGQPVSMDNMKEVYAYCSERGIPVFFDATRMAENAFMIQQRDDRYHETPVGDIVREMMSYGDGCTVSGKKDYLINIGGILAFRDNSEWRDKAEEMIRVYEGNITDGGLCAADLAAITEGVIEMTDDQHIRARVKQTEYLGKLLLEAGIPIVTPPGSHAIFLDAKRFLPHIDQDEYPAQRLAAEVFAETGVRVMERGNVSKGRNPETGKNYRPALELVRLTIPRRVYTYDHMKAVAEGIIRVYERRNELHGLTFTYEPSRLRFFQARFEEK